MTSSEVRIRASCEKRVGTTIEDKYRLDELLGFGATGAVYRAQNVWAGRPCAVKVFHYEGPAKQGVLRRFVREAQATNRVVRQGKLHPHVVDAIDVGRDKASGSFFVVQELLKGRTLSAHLELQPGLRLDLPGTLAILRPIVDAIAAAHEAGIVHRDLKPDNIFLVDVGDDLPPVPKVLDFGIAQLNDARVTTEHELLGTPDYMPPEAFVSAASVDTRADVWALGVMFYELLSGTSPFADPRGDYFKTCHRVTRHQPPSLASTVGVRPQFWNVIRRCLAKDPADRYETAGALLDAIDQAMAPIKLLRVPAGMTPPALARALGDPGSLGDAVQISAPSEPRPSGSLPPSPATPSSLPPALGPGLPQFSWWRVAFREGTFSAEHILAVLGLPELALHLELHVLAVALGDAGVTSIAASPLLTSLTGLALRRVGAGAEGFRSLAASVHLANLVGLDLEGNAPDPESVRLLVASPALAGLRILSLAGCGLGDEVAPVLAQAPLLAHLTRLDLGLNQLTSVGARALASSPHLHQGLTLSLVDNPIARPAAKDLAAALQPRVRRVTFT